MDISSKVIKVLKGEGIIVSNGKIPCGSKGKAIEIIHDILRTELAEKLVKKIKRLDIKLDSVELDESRLIEDINITTKDGVVILVFIDIKKKKPITVSYFWQGEYDSGPREVKKSLEEKEALEYIKKFSDSKKSLKLEKNRGKIEGTVYIVWAHAGRFNGWAAVLANSKNEARQIAKDRWLDEGKIDKVQTIEEYAEEEGDIEHIQGDIDRLRKLGDLVEIEWGT